MISDCPFFNLCFRWKIFRTKIVKNSDLCCFSIAGGLKVRGKISWQDYASNVFVGLLLKMSHERKKWFSQMQKKTKDGCKKNKKNKNNLVFIAQMSFEVNDKRLFEI